MRNTQKFAGWCDGAQQAFGGLLRGPCGCSMLPASMPRSTSAFCSITPCPGPLLPRLQRHSRAGSLLTCSAADIRCRLVSAGCTACPPGTRTRHRDPAPRSGCCRCRRWSRTRAGGRPGRVSPRRRRRPWLPAPPPPAAGPTPLKPQGRCPAPRGPPACCDGCSVQESGFAADASRYGTVVSIACAARGTDRSSDPCRRAS